MNLPRNGNQRDNVLSSLSFELKDANLFRVKTSSISRRDTQTLLANVSGTLNCASEVI